MSDRKEDRRRPSYESGGERRSQSYREGESQRPRFGPRETSYTETRRGSRPDLRHAHGGYFDQRTSSPEPMHDPSRLQPHTPERATRPSRESDGSDTRPRNERPRSPTTRSQVPKRRITVPYDQWCGMDDSLSIRANIFANAVMIFPSLAKKFQDAHPNRPSTECFEILIATWYEDDPVTGAENVFKGWTAGLTCKPTEDDVRQLILRARGPELTVQKALQTLLLVTAEVHEMNRDLVNRIPREKIRRVSIHGKVHSDYGEPAMPPTQD